jgi:uncharacterized protein GlcG (DUF336 family)
MKWQTLIFLAATHAFAQMPSTKVMTFDLAETIAHEAMQACRAQGFKVTVIVVDALNEPKALLRDDGATGSTAEVARMKATSAMLYDRPSGPPSVRRPEAKLPANFVPLAIPGTTNGEGGLPIKYHEMTIGAVAVSGAAGGEKDAGCASAALKKVEDKLK